MNAQERRRVAQDARAILAEHRDDAGSFESLLAEPRLLTRLRVIRERLRLAQFNEELRSGGER